MTTKADADLYMLLGEINANVKSSRDDVRTLREEMRTGFDAANQRATNLENRVNAHEARIGNIETTAKTAFTIGRGLWIVFGSAITATIAGLLKLAGVI